MSTVMVIDDDTAVRELLYDALSRRGHAVITAGSGAQAIDMLKQSSRPGLILLDTDMPGLAGVQIARQIRSFDDAVPIVLLQSLSEPELSPQAREAAGVSELLKKGGDVEAFLASLTACLKRMQGRLDGAAKAAGGPKLPGPVLIIDDEPQIQRLLQSFFEERGFKVLVASSGEEGLSALEKQPVVVLLDINMPGMDGLVTLKKIKALKPDLPVIMASGVGEVSIAKEALKSGAYDYITKPLNLEYLETVVLTKVLLGLEG